MVPRQTERREHTMATRIYNTTTGEVHEAELVSDGLNFLSDVMGNSGVEASDRDDADFELDDDETEWWLRWARREQRILDTANELGEDAINAVAWLAAGYGYDLELLQDKEEELLGIKGE